VTAVTVVELGPGDAADLAALYDDYHVWADRDTDRVAAAIDGSDVAVGLREEGTGRLVAAARAVTDGAYYASVYDVVVAEGRRGEGLGAELLAAVVDHDALGDVPRLNAACREGLTGFYADCGFERSRERVKHDGREEDLVHMVYHR
jgi:predicted GNAT family N-acyltransferase